MERSYVPHRDMEKKKKKNEGKREQVLVHSEWWMTSEIQGIRCDLGSI